MMKTHSTVQRGSNSLFNETHLCILFTQSFRAFTDTYVCLHDLCFTILHVHCINLHKLTVVVFHSFYFLDQPCSIAIQNNIYIVCPVNHTSCQSNALDLYKIMILISYHFASSSILFLLTLYFIYFAFVFCNKPFYYKTLQHRMGIHV